MDTKYDDLTLRSEQNDPSRRGSSRMRRVFSILSAVMLGLSVMTLAACEDKSPLEEGVEEMKDEAGDAKREIQDEIDDHS